MQQSQIDDLVRRLIEREGGYVDHPRDPGGETKYGISKRSYPHEDIKNLTVERAAMIYERDFFRPHKLDQLGSVKVAEMVFDWLVHSGAGVVKARERVKALQRLIDVKDDGVVGPKTIAAINQIPEAVLLRAITLDRLFFLLRLTKHPFIVGWVRRLIEVAGI
jgi:lysozyme family protein